MLSNDHFSNYLKQRHCVIEVHIVNNGYSLFADEVISRPQYSEEFIKSFKFSLLKESLGVKQESSRISLINSQWPGL